MAPRWKWIGVALLALAFAGFLYPSLPVLTQLSSAIGGNFSSARSAPQAQAPRGITLDRPDALIYVPTTLEPHRTYPLVVSYSPDANARFMIDFWQELAESQRLIIYSSKLYRNGVPQPLDEMRKHIELALQALPADRNRVILTGLSGGGSFAQDMNSNFPGLAYGMIINTGQFWEQGHALARQNVARYGPMKIRVAMLASPTDFRYHEMQRDAYLLQQWGATVNWIEFAGGHTYAPKAVYGNALQWMLDAASSNSPPAPAGQ